MCSPNKMFFLAIFSIIFLSLSHESSGLKIVVSGYNSKLAVFDVGANSLSVAAEWEVGEAGRDMTWIQVDGDNIWGGHEVGEYEGWSWKRTFMKFHNYGEGFN